MLNKICNVYYCFENTNLPVDITILDGPTEDLLDEEFLISERRDALDVEETTGIHFSCLKKKGTRMQVKSFKRFQMRKKKVDISGSQNH